MFQGLVAALAAFVKPAIDAAMPNLARNPEELRTANALFGSTWGVMLAVGAGLGGLFSQAFGRQAAIVADIVTFVVAGACRHARAPADAAARVDDRAPTPGPADRRHGRGHQPRPPRPGDPRPDVVEGDVRHRRRRRQPARRAGIRGPRQRRPRPRPAARRPRRRLRARPVPRRPLGRAARSAGCSTCAAGPAIAFSVAYVGAAWAPTLLARRRAASRSPTSAAAPSGRCRRTGCRCASTTACSGGSWPATSPSSRSCSA